MPLELVERRHQQDVAGYKQEGFIDDNDEESAVRLVATMMLQHDPSIPPFSSSTRPRTRACFYLALPLPIMAAVTIVMFLVRLLSVEQTVETVDTLLPVSSVAETLQVLADNTTSTSTTFKGIQSNEKDKPCSCYQRRRSCCERKVLRTHKFGYMLTQDFYKPFDPVITRHRIHEQELFNSSSITDNIDYRHLVIVRNMYDAIVSGFLYHQTGHECWLSMTGYKIGREKNFDWPEWRRQQYISHSGPARSI